MAEFQKESLSLEEANRVRISLGLKPLVDVDVHDDDGPAVAADAAQGLGCLRNHPPRIGAPQGARKGLQR